MIKAEIERLLAVPHSASTENSTGGPSAELREVAAKCPDHAVVSPVGVNCEIIDHGRNGFCATTPEEWHATLRQLVDDPGIAARLGVLVYPSEWPSASR